MSNTKNVVYTLAASGASEQTLSDARFFLRLLTGRKRKSGKLALSKQAAATTVTPEGEVKISRTPQASYVSKADHFSNLVRVVSSEPNYTPNEVELKLASIIGKASDDSTD